MSDVKDNCVNVVTHIRDLRGNSQPKLVLGSDEVIYVLKHYSNPETSNQAFNDSAGTELYRAYGLSVPHWKPLLLPNELIEIDPGPWNHARGGICFGSKYLCQLDNPGSCYDFFPSSRKAAIRNLGSFWLAWLLDVCCQHSASRHVVFQENLVSERDYREYEAFFIDHDCLFGGPSGENRPDPIVARYQTPSFYGEPFPEQIYEIKQKILSIDVDSIWGCIAKLPDAWKTQSALSAFSAALNRLSTSTFVEGALIEIARLQRDSSQGTPTVSLSASESLPPAAHRVLIGSQVLSTQTIRCT